MRKGNADNVCRVNYMTRLKKKEREKKRGVGGGMGVGWGGEL